MKPSELYAREPERIDKNLSCLSLCYHSHVPALEPLEQFDLSKNERVTVRYYKDHYFDHRRFWRLASVWIDQQPVMMIQNAGREGDDFHCTYVTDPDAYNAMVGYIASLGIKPPSNPLAKSDFLFVSPEKEIPGLTDFYDHDLETVSSDRW